MAVMTVAQFAAQLGRPTSALIEQLVSAGVAKQSPDDALTEADKERLLDFLRTSHGTEWRYVVPLHLRWGDVEKRVQVNLYDRSPMAYKMLLGRDFLRGDFLVDVDRNPID